MWQNIVAKQILNLSSQAPAPKKKPTVKWRDMSSTIFGSKKRKRTTNETDNTDSDVEDDVAEDPPDQPADGNSDTISEDEETKDDAEDDIADDSEGETFDISDTIDLELKELADVLSEKDLMVKKSVMKNEEPVAVSQKNLSEDDWSM